MRGRIDPLALATPWFALLACAAGAYAQSADPADVPGLRARWDASSLRRSLDNGDKVTLWPDVTEHGHDLSATAQPAPDYYDDQVHREPVVYVRGAPMSMAAPFSLGGHTIFIVYRTEGGSDKALFHGDSESQGVLLRGADGHVDAYQDNPTARFDYGTPTPPADDYRITVLARDGSRLRSWLNGEDVSSNAEFPKPISVNGFFFVKRTAYVQSTGNGLAIAEMLFYDRFLSDREREAVTSYLAAKYGVPVTASSATSESATAPAAAPRSQGTGIAQLSTTTALNVNGELVAIPWDIADVVEVPFAHDTKTASTRLVCTRDGTRVRLHVSLLLMASVAHANVRVLFLLNGEKYLRGEGWSGDLGAAEGGMKGTVTAEVLTTLNSGDYVEVITQRGGAEGAVTLASDTAVFVAQAL